MRLALVGDPEAERLFFAELEKKLVQLARQHSLMGKLRRVTSPEDVAAEVLVRCLAARAFQRFEDRGTGSLQRFLSVVLERTLLDIERRARSAKRRHHRTVAPASSRAPDMPFDPPSNDPTPTSIVRTSELAQVCERLLNGRELEVWRLMEGQGLTPKEVARELGIAPSTVRSIFCRARAKLIEALDPSVGPTV
jgi:RNA polymerase sigma factor (sigma-70 family)